MLVVITILTTLTLTTTIAAYAGGDGNGQKAEDDSSVGISDCDDDEVEEARFLCNALATNDVEIEPQEEERATLSVCKEVGTTTLSPEDFTFTVTGNDPSPAQFQGSADCVDVTVGPGEYTVSETAEFGFGTSILGDCVQGPEFATATGEIQVGETQECIFSNFGAACLHFFFPSSVLAIIKKTTVRNGLTQYATKWHTAAG